MKKEEEDPQDNNTGNKNVARDDVHEKRPTPTIQFLTKLPGPVRINANKRGIWG